MGFILHTQLFLTNSIDPVSRAMNRTAMALLGPRKPVTLNLRSPPTHPYLSSRLHLRAALHSRDNLRISSLVWDRPVTRRRDETSCSASTSDHPSEGKSCSRSPQPTWPWAQFGRSVVVKSTVRLLGALAFVLLSGLVTIVRPAAAAQDTAAAAVADRRATHGHATSTSSGKPAGMSDTLR